MASPPLSEKWVPLWPQGQSVPPPVEGRWLKGSGGAMVWSPLTAADIPGVGVPNGIATLGADGKVPAAQLNVQPLPARLGPTTPTITDWNNVLESGWYMAYGAPNGIPSGGWTQAQVWSYDASAYVVQRGWDFTAGVGSPIYERKKVNGSWSAWVHQSIVWCGAWSGATAYGPGAIVSYGGRYFMAATQTTNSAPW